MIPDTPVTHGELKEIVENILDCISDAKKIDNSATDEMFELLIKQINYNRTRDLMFFTALIGQLYGFSQDALLSQYETYCAEFDKLNKKE